ncbi:hypothetical protein Z043_106736 [Scleropages formosus]|uniref:Ig-like domain-containing protein n=1 Tax=Scleropages formosus TaxID=113540 RepID=A0A0P7Z160_SCLFO|nr:hypothetical protein Z043_106736 [Scleropages formosus]
MSHAVSISQTPRDALQKAGSPFEITCEHDSNNDYMFWYRQDQNWSLTLIAYSYGVGFEENEKDFEAEYKVKRHSITLFTLEIERPEERDTAAVQWKTYGIMLPAVFLCLLLCTTPSLSSDPGVLQTPHDLIVNVDAQVTLGCSMPPGVSMSSYTMQWYRQGHSGGMVEFLKNEYSQADERDRFKVSIATSENRFTLQIHNLISNDSATYYCATSHESADGANVVQDLTDLFIKSGSSSVTLRCEHDKNDYFNMYWYKQTAGAMDLLTYSTASESATTEPPFRLTAGVTVNQNKPVIITEAGTLSEVLHCEHDDSNHFYMYWYKQNNQRMDLLAYSTAVNSANTEPPFNGSKYEMKLTDGVNIVQNISRLYTTSGSLSVLLHCEHDDGSYTDIFWYKQSFRTMDLLAYSRAQRSANTEAPFSESKYTMSRPEVKKSSLEIKNLEPGDSAGTSSTTLHCDHDDNTHLTMFWYKQTTGAMDLLAYSLGKGSVLHCEQDDSSYLYMYWYKQTTGAMDLLAYSLGKGSLTNGVNVFQKIPVLFAQTGAESVTLNCEHDDSSYYYMFWYKHNIGKMDLLAYSGSSGSATTEPPFSESKYKMIRLAVLNSSLEIKNLDPGDSAVVNYDPAYFGSGTKLTVIEHDLERPRVKVLPPSPQQICNKATVTLVCVVTNFYPDHVEVNWKFNGVDVGTVGVSTDDRALQAPDGKTYSITSRFLTTKKRWFNTKNTFTCVTKFYNGTQDEFFQGSINGDKGGVSAETVKQDALWAKLSYGILIAKSFFYGLFVFAVVWKLRRSSGKRQM